MSPWHWYFTDGLLKALPVPLLLTALGMVWRVPGWKMMLPSAAFLAVFSYLPHKELRFLFPIFPVFTLIGASFLNTLYMEYFALLIHI